MVAKRMEVHLAERGEPFGGRGTGSPLEVCSYFFSDQRCRLQVGSR
jgi:hypothetical protein